MKIKDKLIVNLVMTSAQKNDRESYSPTIDMEYTRSGTSHL